MPSVVRIALLPFAAVIQLRWSGTRADQAGFDPWPALQRRNASGQHPARQRCTAFPGKSFVRDRV